MYNLALSSFCDSLFIISHLFWFVKLFFKTFLKNFSELFFRLTALNRRLIYSTTFLPLCQYFFSTFFAFVTLSLPASPFLSLFMLFLTTLLHIMRPKTYIQGLFPKEQSSLPQGIYKQFSLFYHQISSLSLRFFFLSSLKNSVKSPAHSFSITPPTTSAS